MRQLDIHAVAEEMKRRWIKKREEKNRIGAAGGNEWDVLIVKSRTSKIRRSRGDTKVRGIVERHATGPFRTWRRVSTECIGRGEPGRKKRSGSHGCQRQGRSRATGNLSSENSDRTHREKDEEPSGHSDAKLMDDDDGEQKKNWQWEEVV